MIDIAKNSNLVQDLIDSFGVTDLGAFHGGDSSVVEVGLVDLAEAAGAEEVLLGEVVSCSGDLPGGVNLGDFATTSAGV